MSIEDASDLDVSTIRQRPDRAECVPACLKMVIDYMNAHLLTEPAATLEVSELAAMVKTEYTGTEINDVKRLNGELAIMQAAPSLEFDAAEKPREMEDIEEDLKKGLPLIAWIGKGKDPFMWKHAVVIVNVSRSRQWIRYNDPTHGDRKHVDLDEFSKEWYAADRWLVRLILGRRDTRKMTEFVRRPVKAR